ncbi:unnamed protein product [Durusdinium trenchii]|uniref:Uncharacterized protein n=1 Tax=Durusdinium trenchii TaxID=1381693 RepID=A0ABP0PQY5_9DINO
MPKRSAEGSVKAASQGDKLLAVLEGFSLDATPKEQDQAVGAGQRLGSDAKAKAKPKAKPKGKPREDVKAKAKAKSQKPQQDAKAKAKPEKLEAKSKKPEPVQPEAKPEDRRASPTTAAVANSDDLKAQFHAALGKLDALACVNRERVIPEL